MSNIYFFRGKAATGKSTITNILSSKINVPVLRKDDIFDVLSHYIKDNSQNNSISYDLLSKLIQTNINNKTDIILDIGLSNTNGWRTFQSKLDFKDSKIFTFLCDCSNLSIWKMRFIERLKSPTPNQYFKTTEEAIEYYERSEIEVLDNEYYIDSSDSLENILGFIHEKIRLNTTLKDY